MLMPGIEEIRRAICEKKPRKTQEIWSAIKKYPKLAQCQFNLLKAVPRRILVVDLRRAGLKPEEVFPKELIYSCMKLGK